MSARKTTHEEVSSRFIQAYYTLYGMRKISTKREFCIALGMPPQNFHPIETGLRTASVPNLCSLIDAYSVSPTWLFLGTGDMFM